MERKPGRGETRKSAARRLRMGQASEAHSRSGIAVGRAGAWPGGGRRATRGLPGTTKRGTGLGGEERERVYDKISFLLLSHVFL